MGNIHSKKNVVGGGARSDGWVEKKALTGYEKSAIHLQLLINTFVSIHCYMHIYILHRCIYVRSAGGGGGGSEEEKKRTREKDNQDDEELKKMKKKMNRPPLERERKYEFVS